MNNSVESRSVVRGVLDERRNLTTTTDRETRTGEAQRSGADRAALRTVMDEREKERGRGMAVAERKVRRIGNAIAKEKATENESVATNNSCALACISSICTRALPRRT
jgi:hypothetical protein